MTQGYGCMTVGHLDMPPIPSPTPPPLGFPSAPPPPPPHVFCLLKLNLWVKKELLLPCGGYGSQALCMMRHARCSGILERLIHRWPFRPAGVARNQIPLTHWLLGTWGTCLATAIVKVTCLAVQYCCCCCQLSKYAGGFRAYEALLSLDM